MNVKTISIRNPSPRSPDAVSAPPLSRDKALQVLWKGSLIRLPALVDQNWFDLLSKPPDLLFKLGRTLIVGAHLGL
jgi:hypothetical protein